MTPPASSRCTRRLVPYNPSSSAATVHQLPAETSDPLRETTTWCSRAGQQIAATCSSGSAHLHRALDLRGQRAPDRHARSRARRSCDRSIDRSPTMARSRRARPPSARSPSRPRSSRPARVQVVVHPLHLAGKRSHPVPCGHQRRTDRPRPARRHRTSPRRPPRPSPDRPARPPRPRSPARYLRRVAQPIRCGKPIRSPPSSRPRPMPADTRTHGRLPHRVHRPRSPGAPTQTG